MTTHISLDFETLGLGENAALLSIGAVAFDPASGELGSEFYSAIDPRTQPNRDIDPSTVLWWLKQDDAARSKITDALKFTDMIESGEVDALEGEAVEEVFENAAHPIHHVARAFINWVEHFNDEVEVWTNGSVDHAWLESMMKYSGLKNPIKFWNQRDYRTLKALYPDVTAEFSGVKHNALDDAIHQAKHAMAILRAHGQYSAKQIAADIKAADQYDIEPEV